MRRAIVVFFVLAVGMFSGVSACGGDGDGDSDDHHGGNPAEVGNSCETADDCETDRCYTGPGGGYCTTECQNEGATENCPDDTICKPIQGGPARCLLICGSESACGDADACGDGYCPDGSSCVDIADSDGHRACEPNPSGE